jgi:hypothetical protein
MRHRGVEYSVVKLVERSGWRWEISFGEGKTKSGVTALGRVAAIKIAEAKIDRFLRNGSIRAA